jgi:hypothetical protein
VGGRNRQKRAHQVALAVEFEVHHIFDFEQRIPLDLTP